MPNQAISSARAALARRLSGFLPGHEANAESWRWFEEGLGWGRARVFAHGEEPIPEDAQKQIDGWFDRRERGEPWAYILGWAAWGGRRFRVSPATLIPRPETEMALEAALSLAGLVNARRAVDVGTGAGVLGISLALDSGLEVTATDICGGALAIAKQNAQELGASLKWARGDLLGPVEGPIELVVSNPPYIAPEDEGALQRELSFEPRMALFAPGHGMGVITRLLSESFERGASALVSEIGSGQGGELQSRAFNVGWQNVEIKRDIAGHERVLTATR